MRRCTARQLAVLLLLILVCIAFSGCGSRNRFSGDAEIVCTIFPLYDWTKNVLGDAVAAHPVRLLSENGNDPHNYQPTVSDITGA